MLSGDLNFREYERVLQTNKKLILMDTFAYKGISDGKYVEGNIEAINSDEASHKLKDQKIIITNLVRAAKGKKTGRKKEEKRKVLFLYLEKRRLKLRMY